MERSGPPKTTILILYSKHCITHVASPHYHDSGGNGGGSGGRNDTKFYPVLHTVESITDYNGKYYCLTDKAIIKKPKKKRDMKWILMAESRSKIPLILIC